MVVSKIVDLPDSSETGDDLVIPDMMFMQGKEPVGVSMALSLSSSSVSSHPIDGPPYHCSWRTVLVMAWTDANPGRCFYKCYLHGFFTWDDTEEPHGWQKLSLLEARNQIHRLREDKKSIYNKITELQKQLTVQATAEPAHRPAEEEIDLSTMQNSVYSNREKMLRQFFLISWGGCIATTAIILYSLKPYI
ncbi:unnamed protein product [Brassica oleracea var. botrytis]|uniref:DUF7900 domain-containing protein n=2 Tax=Brassica oleracea TaxID=3712 RepID=A0A0D3BHV1_BRAOL|nr:unnamed protein product [Brassica oleracea]